MVLDCKVSPVNSMTLLIKSSPGISLKGASPIISVPVTPIFDSGAMIIIIQTCVVAMKRNGILIFVYNADSGLLNSVKDLVHKNLRPKTYPCRLCALTYNNTGMRSQWKDFVNGLDNDVIFLHKDELKDQYPDMDPELPAAFILIDGRMRSFISAGEMNGLGSLNELMEMVSSRINGLS